MSCETLKATIPIRRFSKLLLAGTLLSTVAACSDSVSPASGDISKVNHIVVIYVENHSFDNMYGQFAGAEGLSSSAALSAAKQVDANGTVYTTLPQANGSPLPTTLANTPFDIDTYQPPAVATADLVHRFYQDRMGMR